MLARTAPPPDAAQSRVWCCPPGLQGRRPRRWVSKLHSRDLSEKWAALQTAVPCLHPSHKFQRVVDGPERAVVFSAGRQPGEGAAAATAAAAAAAAGPAPPPTAVAATSSSSDVSGSSGSGGSGSGLDQFLATFPPSAASCRDVAWIVVSHPEGPKQQHEQQRQQQQEQQPANSSSSTHSGSLEERIALAVEEWEQLAGTAAASGRRPTAADVDGLAAKHGILGGKWMLFARSGAEADAAWPVVARAVCGEGPQAQPLCRSAKISSAGPAEADGSWVLLVYTDNYTVGGRCIALFRHAAIPAVPPLPACRTMTRPPASLHIHSRPPQDAADVQRVRQGLQRALPPGLLQDRRLLYKADIYTHLGIYSRNEWQLKPTVYEARLA